MSNPFLGKPEGSGDQAWTWDDATQSWKLVPTGSLGGGGGSSGPDADWTVGSNDGLFTTSSVSIGTTDDAQSQGTDVVFFVSGAISGSEKAVFGGDVRISGTLVVGTGSLHIEGSSIRSTEQITFFDSQNPSGVTLSTIQSGSSIGSSTPTPVTLTASYHDLTHNPSGLWQMSGSGVDSSGNGYNLSISSGGTQRFIEFAPGLLGAHID